MRKLLLLAVLFLLFAGCHPNTHNTPPVVPVTPIAPAAATSTQPPLGEPRFRDITAQAGINWVHNPCRTGKKLLPETVGGGGGFLDYNHDGKLDILLINGAPLPGYQGPRPHLALYRNNGDGTFTDVTRESGLDFAGYGLGAAIGDYDNDGWPDIYITALDGNRLYHNDHGHFRDVTARAGVGVHNFSTGAAWIDYDRDGHLDLFVSDYVDWSPQTDLPCGPPDARQYCAPNQYRGARPYLFRNRGDSTFEDVSAKSGVLGHPGKTLGVTVYDFNNDGWPDLYLANDTVADVLLINNQHGGFTDQALTAGVALGDDGQATGSMGVDVATPFNDGRACIAVGTFATQELSLFVAAAGAPPGTALFENRKREAGIADPTRPMTTFGLAFADVDLDGWPDLIVLNGHIDDDPSLHVGQERVPYRQRPQLFQNQRNGTFRDVAAAAGLTTPLIGRALAVGDIDNDGRPDLLAIENGGPVHLWHNETKPVGAWLGVELVGTRSPRDGTGAMVTLSGPGWTQTRCATTARSYLAFCDPRILFGVGHNTPDQLTVRWPSGTVTVLKHPALNRYLRVEER
jgi:enediyne biosynthesis protein E4